MTMWRTIEDLQADIEAGVAELVAGEGWQRWLTVAAKLSTAAVDWLKANFFKTELELGHCLRLPAEGPCECDLFLTCAKFVTTPAYAPRLRQRYATELELAAEATDHGWNREVERHTAIARRIACLLADLDEPLTDPNDNVSQEPLLAAPAH